MIPATVIALEVVLGLRLASFDHPHLRLRAFASEKLQPRRAVSRFVPVTVAYSAADASTFVLRA